MSWQRVAGGRTVGQNRTPEGLESHRPRRNTLLGHFPVRLLAFVVYNRVSRVGVDTGSLEATMVFLHCVDRWLNWRLLTSVFLFVVLCCHVRWTEADDATPAADELRLTGRYEEAVEAYRMLAETEPLASALGIARCRRATGKYDEARTVLVESVKQHADEAEAADLLAELASLEFETGDYASARTHVEAALKLHDKQLVARWIDAELQRVAGRLADAQNGYVWFIRQYNRFQREIKDPDDLRWIGLGAAQYARWRRNPGQFAFLVNTLYPKALKFNENYWPANFEAGLLFLEKYNVGDASDEFDAALAINATAAQVHAAKARLELDKYNLKSARTSFERALEINPRLIEAHWLRAEYHLLNFRLEEAAKLLEETRKLNPVNESTLGRLAAVYGAIDGLKQDTAGTRMGDLIEQAVQRNEHCGEFFYALARTLDRIRKYPHAARYYEETHKRMPQLVGARGRLGLMHMRLGDEVQAARLLDESFKIDPFNVRVKNMLTVLDTLKNYAVLETAHFVIKFDRGHDELLAKYMAGYLEEEVYPAVVKRFGYEPEGKSLFEIFNRSGQTSGHEWFSARMVGLPYVGTVGACAGKMVAMASPNDMPEKFNWARVVRHEFVHIVNLQQTDFNIPHWYTEALAVLNEDFPRPPSWNRLLASRLADDSLFTLDTINFGFIRPESPGDRALAYCQAELYAQYMMQQFGDDALGNLLEAYADNLSTSAAIQRCFGIAEQEFETGFKRYVTKTVAGLRLGAEKRVLDFAELQEAAKENPDDAGLIAQLALAHLARGDNAEARRLAVAARKKDAKHQLAAYVLARLYLSIGDTDQALKLLEESVDEQNPQENALALLAGLKLRAKDYIAAQRLYQLGSKRYPHADKWLKALAQVYVASDDLEKLEPVLQRLVELDADSLSLRKKLAAIALARNDFDAAARWAREALYIDVMDAEIHATLGKAMAKLKQTERAAEHFQNAIRLDPKQTGWRLALAKNYVEAGQNDKAKSALTGLLEIAPEHKLAAAMLESLNSDQ